MTRMINRSIRRFGAVALTALSLPASADVALYLNGALDPDGTGGSPLWGDATVFDSNSGYTVEAFGGATGRLDVTVSGLQPRFIRATLDTPEGIAAFAPGLYQGAIHGGGVLNATPHLPGLDVSANSLSCNNVNGWFRVHESAFGPDESITRLAVDFLHFCDGEPIPLFGAIRVNSSIPLPARDVYAVAGRDQVVDAGASVELDGGYSRSVSNAPTQYRWTQTAGPAVQLSGGTTAGPTFVAPAVPAGGRTFTFSLEATAPGGRRDSDTVSVFVHHPADPQTRAMISSPVGEPLLDYIRGYYSPSLHGEDVTDFVYVFRAPDWPLVARMNSESVAYVAWQGAFPLRRDRVTPGTLEARFDTLFQSAGVPLAVGRYRFIQSADANSTVVPYLDVSGHGAGCDHGVGAFEVLELEYPLPISPTTGSDFTRLAIDFEQRCAGANTVSVPIRGSVRVNSSVPLHDGLVPPPPDPRPVSVQFTITPLPVAVNQEATFTWSSVNAEFCYGFNGFPLSGALSTSGSVRTSFANQREQDIFVSCYSVNGVATDLKRLSVVAATAGGGSSGGGSTGSSGGGGAIDVVILAMLAIAVLCRRVHSRPTRGATYELAPDRDLLKNRVGEPATTKSSNPKVAYNPRARVFAS